MRPYKLALLCAAVATLMLVALSSAAAPPQQTCQAAKNRAAGAYAACRQNAAGKLATAGDGTKYNTAVARCKEKFTKAWGKADEKAHKKNVECPDRAPNGEQFESVIGQHTDNVQAGLNGSGLRDFVTELGTCNGNLAGCDDARTQCQDKLDTCEAQPPGQLLKTGETIAYGPGSDGMLQKGLSRAYVDNGDGTITDTRTGLMWEKKSNDGSIHDKDDGYTWCVDENGDNHCDTGTRAMDGTIATTFLATLNSGEGFAGYTDWRIPNVNELHSLVDYGTDFPAIAPAFNTACPLLCTVLTCSCTADDWSSFPSYWSSTTFAGYPDSAWVVLSYLGAVDYRLKNSTYYVRAVRGGS